MKNKSYFSHIIGFLNPAILSTMCILLLGSFSTESSAATVLYKINNTGVFSGSSFGGFFQATFVDNGANTVTLTLTSNNLTGTEKVNDVFFNFNPTKNPASLTITPANLNTPGSGLVLSKSTNCCQADGLSGNRKFDIELKYTSNHPIVSGVDYTYTITGPSVTAADFNFLNQTGIYYAAAHIQNTGSGYGSTWAGTSTSGIQAPEPQTYLLLGSCLMIGILLKRLQKKNPREREDRLT